MNRLIMGTGVSIDIPDAEEKIFNKVFKRLIQIDERFSTYKPESEVSKYIRGEITEGQISHELKQVIKACKTAEKATDGTFSAWAGHSFDPSGYVKGWSIAEGAKIIKKAGYKTFCIGIGGDILAASNSERIWRIGIQDPAHKNQILTTLSVKNAAVATSGTYERGLHIINPKTHEPSSSILSITVVGADIIDADVLATSAFVQGEFGLNFIGGKALGYEAIMVGKNGEVSITSGMGEYLG
jgi:thiamine biosynthesis lipoprotein